MPLLTQQNLLVLAAVGVSSVLLALWQVSLPAALRRAQVWLAGGRFRLAGGLVGGAFLLWIAIFHLYGFGVSGDVRVFFQPQGRAALAGDIPHVSFRSSYMPLFPYLMGALDSICRDDRMIPAFFTACFAAAGLVLVRLLRTAGESSERIAAQVPCAMFTGASWLLAIGYQQDESLMLVISLAGALLLARGQAFLGGFLLGAGLLFTKVLAGLAALPLLCHGRRPARALAGFAVGVAPLAVFLALLVAPQNLLSKEMTAVVPPSLTALALALPGLRVNEGRWVYLGHALVFAWAIGTGLWGLLRRKSSVGADALMQGATVCWLGFLLLSPKSLTSYRLMILPLLPVVLRHYFHERPWRAALFALYSFACGVQYMLYEDWLAARTYGSVFGAGPSDLIYPAYILIAIDVVILGSEVVWLWRGLTCRPPILSQDDSPAGVDSDHE
jgi:hypothetical protein